MPILYWLLVIIFVSGRHVNTDSEVYLRPYLYIFVTSPTETWTNAKSACERKQAALAKIDSSTTRLLIVNNFPTGHGAIWIGANDKDVEKQWRWVSDGSLVGDRSNWVKGGPDNWKGREDCVAINRAGKWNDVFCSDSSRKKGFVCQRHIFTVDQQYVLSFSYDLKTWSEAKRECEKDASHLVKIDSDSLKTATTQNRNKNGTWIGASDNDSEGDWKWLDGTSAGKTSGIYNNWNTREPNGKSNENCAVVLRNGKWNDLSCAKRLRYICQKDMIIFTDRYKLFFSYGKKTWAQAKAECTKNGLHLIKIDSAALTKVVRDNSTDRRWIGLSDTVVEGQWRWLDGNVATYQNWANRYPQSDTMTDAYDCAYAVSSGKWYSANCGHRLKFICQKRLPTSLSHNRHVFIFYRREKGSWQAAKNACVAAGSRLAEIQDTATNLAIKSKIMHPTAEFYGGGTVSSGRVTWDSGTTASFTSGWAAGVPNSAQEAKIALTVSGWKDVSSSKVLPYICERATLTTVTLSKTQHVIGVGSDEEVGCSADGIPLSEVVWKFSSGNVSLVSSDAVFQVKGNGRSGLNFGKSTLMDEGLYTCYASNRSGNRRKTMTARFNLTVPSTPEFVIAEALECSTNITVRWKANSLARNVNHKVVLTNSGNASETYEFSNHPNETFTFQVKKWMIYNITVTPTPKSGPKLSYVISNYTRRRTKGLPGRVRNFTAQLWKQYSCRLSWLKPHDVPLECTTNYKVTIAGRLHYSPHRSIVIESTSETINSNNTTYIFHGKANVQYMFGIQTQTCAGLGEIIWKNDTCVTDSKAPDVVAKPQFTKAVTSESTMQGTIQIPSRKSGPISCIFVIVNVQQPGSNGSEFASSDPFTRDDLIRANHTISAEYIALALEIQKLSEDQLKIILGNENVTHCDASPTAKRQKREVRNNKFVGRNLKLDQYKNITVFIVTATPIKGGVLFKASGSVQVDAIHETIVGPKDSGGTITIAAAAGGGGAAFIIFLAVINVVVKTRKYVY